LFESAVIAPKAVNGVSQQQGNQEHKAFFPGLVLFFEKPDSFASVITTAHTPHQRRNYAELPWNIAGLLKADKIHDNII